MTRLAAPSTGMHPSVIVILMCLLLHAPAPASAQASSRWLRMGAIAGAVGAAAALDPLVRVGHADGGSGISRSLAEYGSHLGDWYPATIVLGGVYLFSTPGGGTRESVKRIVRAAATASVFTRIVKITTGRVRPFLTDDSDEFVPVSFDGMHNSFPSGHTTLIFAIAQAVDDEVDNPVIEAALYSAGGLVAWSRVRQNRHWLSDVVAGAFSGIVVTRALRDGRILPGDVTFAAGLRGVTLSIPVGF